MQFYFFFVILDNVSLHILGNGFDITPKLQQMQMHCASCSVRQQS